jgi:EAL domain-containing protein (putative c-di-GMP-specific phosphodiesterase class I)
VAVDAHGDVPAGAGGANAWRQQITEALTQQRAQLQHTPVRDREGRTLHLACTLHLQLAPGAAHQPPRLWLAWARRAHLLPRVDLLTVQSALQALAADSRPRCVRVAAASWSSPGFVLAVQALLQSAPTQARALAIELAEPDSGGSGDGQSAAWAAWAPCGVSLGVGHGRVMPPDLMTLHAAGFSFVTVAGDHLRGVAADAALRAYAQGWLQLVHDLGLLALVDGVADPRDLEVLWALGLDGAAAKPPPAF